MTRKPRRDVILRRFMAGEPIVHIVHAYWGTQLRTDDVEAAIRDALNGKTRIP